jgi:hypothetical protein
VVKGNGRTNTVPAQRYIAPTGELKVDPYAFWRQAHMRELLAIVALAETPPAERVWPPEAEKPNGR